MRVYRYRNALAQPLILQEIDHLLGRETIAMRTSKYPTKQCHLFSFRPCFWHTARDSIFVHQINVVSIDRQDGVFGRRALSTLLYPQEKKRYSSRMDLMNISAYAEYGNTTIQYNVRNPTKPCLFFRTKRSFPEGLPGPAVEPVRDPVVGLELLQHLGTVDG